MDVNLVLALALFFVGASDAMIARSVLPAQLKQKNPNPTPEQMKQQALVLKALNGFALAAILGGIAVLFIKPL